MEWFDRDLKSWIDRNIKDHLVPTSHAMVRDSLLDQAVPSPVQSVQCTHMFGFLVGDTAVFFILKSFMYDLLWGGPV